MDEPSGSAVALVDLFVGLRTARFATVIAGGQVVACLTAESDRLVVKKINEAAVQNIIELAKHAGSSGTYPGSATSSRTRGHLSITGAIVMPPVPSTRRFNLHSSFDKLIWCDFKWDPW